MKRLFAVAVLVCLFLPRPAFCVDPARAIWTQRSFDSGHKAAVSWEVGPSFAPSIAVPLKENIEGVATYGDVIICHGGNGSVFALSKIGQLLWATKTDSKPIGVPMVYKGNIFTMKENGKLQRTVEKNGDVVSDVKLFPAGTTDVTRWGHYGIVGGSSQLVCINLFNGARQWSLALDWDPLPVAASSNVVVVNTSKMLSCVSIINGKTLWQKDFGTSLAGVPTVSEDRIYVATVNGNFICARLWDGEKLWEAPRGYSRAGATVDGNRLFIPGDGAVLCYNAVTGKQIWKTSLSKENLWAQIIKTGNTLHVAGTDFKLYQLDAQDGKTLSNIALMGRVSQEMAVGIDYLVFGDGNKRLYIFPSKPR